MKNTCVWVLGALSAVLAGSCDDEDNNAACSAFTPCGGNVVGTWEVTDACLSGNLEFPGCPAATTSFEGLGATGTVTFNADMTGTSNITTRGSVKMTLPASCLMGASCAQLDTAIKSDPELTGPDSDFSSASCSGSGACTCTLTLKPSAMMSGGSWSTSGNRLIQGGDVNEYCATESELKIQTEAASSGMMEDVRFGLRLKKK